MIKTYLTRLTKGMISYPTAVDAMSFIGIYYLERRTEEQRIKLTEATTNSMDIFKVKSHDHIWRKTIVLGAVLRKNRLNR